mmetsp:Transcript_12944/g.33731  ORF Transcript_12944/g.33731 Transcript_12944/m.33731 type:complete len:266 (+) Transcript_12944:44-841(+)
MSSLRNAVKRRTYKERAQPKARQHLGLLEKHKDYSLRAKNYNSKQARLKVLREKAAMRNPEEFYFGMVRAKTKEGVHDVGSQNASLPMRTMRVFKAQDSAYLATKRNIEARRVEKLHATLHNLGTARPSAHTIFFDNEDEADGFDPATHFGTVPDLADRAFNRPRAEALARERAVIVPKHVESAAKSDPRVLTKYVGKVHRQQRAAYNELEQRTRRKEKIAAQAQSVDEERARMGTGAKKKRLVDVGDGSDRKRAVFKWKPERKR